MHRSDVPQRGQPWAVRDRLRAIAAECRSDSAAWHRHHERAILAGEPIVARLIKANALRLGAWRPDGAADDRQEGGVA